MGGEADVAQLPDTSIPFAKMNGSGNDFVVIDNRAGVIEDAAAGEFTRLVCRRGLGVGADGVVLIEEAPRGSDVDFRWRYLNADGSDGEMCGNGAMCGARFAARQRIAPEHCRFLTPSGVVAAEVVDAERRPDVRLAMVAPSPIRSNLNLDDAPNVTAFDYVRVGVPHVVAVAPDADAFADAAAFAAWGRAIRNHPEVAPDGANVNLIHRLGPDTIRMRTYERGVEAETLACGTGAVASALVAVRRGLVTPPVTVITSSTRLLTVSWDGDGETVRDVRLRGEARFVAWGVLDPEGLS
jgi:diaminopimelate epimerase